MNPSISWQLFAAVLGANGVAFVSQPGPRTAIVGATALVVALEQLVRLLTHKAAVSAAVAAKTQQARIEEAITARTPAGPYLTPPPPLVHRPVVTAPANVSRETGPVL